MALQGTLDTFALPDVLRLLASTRKRGCLHITGSRGSGDLWVNDGSIVAAEAAGLRSDSGAVDVLFELLRYPDGSFSFEQDALHATPGKMLDVDNLLRDAEAQLAEWTEIEKVVPSLECWVRLVRDLPTPELTMTSDRWRSITAVGSGTTVRRMGDDLELAEVAVCRNVKELVEAGLAEVEVDAPAAQEVEVEHTSYAPPAPDETPFEVEMPTSVQPAESDAAPSFEPLVFDNAADRIEVIEEPTSGGAGFDGDADLLAGVFPGLNGSSSEEPPAPVAAPMFGEVVDAPLDDPDVARQLANLSPKAAAAVQAAAEAATDEERNAALDMATEDDTINRGLLLKFLSSVRS